MKRFLTALTLAVGLWLEASAQPGKHAVTHVVVHTVVQDQPMEDATVVFSQGKITAILRGPAPADCRVVDGRGQHLYPSLIDPDSLLGLIEVESIRATHDFREVGEINPDLRADIAFHPESKLLAVACSAGHLVAGVQPRGGLICGRGSVMKLSGWTREDMTVLPASNVCVEWPDYGVRRDGDEPAAEEQIKKRRLALEQLNGAFANARSYRPQEGQDLFWEALQDALSGQRPVFVRAQRLDQIEDAIAWSKRLGVRMVLVGGADAWRLADKLAEHKVSVVYTETLRLPMRDHEAHDTYYKAPEVLRKAGVPVALSMGGEGANVRWLTQAGGLLQAFGMAPARVLEAMTLAPARILGVGHRLGSLEVGKDATFFLASGDVLDGRSKILRAWIDGNEIDLNDSQKKLYQRYRQRPFLPQQR